MTTKSKPVHAVKIGLIEAAIWKNETEGRVRYNVTVGRRYAVEENGKQVWRSTDSFGRDDLLTLAKAIDLAHTFVCESMSSKAEAEAPAN